MIDVKQLELENLKGLPHGMKLWYGEVPGEEVNEKRKYMIRTMFATPDSFLRICSIQTNEGTKSLMVPTRAQMIVAQAYQDNHWIYVSKYRQAMISTVTAMLMLRDTMYGEAIKTAIVAQDRDTCDEIMDRIIYAYENLPEALKNPLKRGTKATRERIEFANGNQITSITVGSKSPGVGKSRDRVHITEGCEMEDDTLRKLQEKLFPAVESRPNARVVFETTPGDYGSRLHRLWTNTWNPPPGQPARFTPIFLEWWKDHRRQLKDPTTEELIELGPLTPAEKLLMHQMKGCTRHHMYFRRAVLPATFDNKPDRFDNKYPPGPLEGWLTTSNKIYSGESADYLRELREQAGQEREEVGESGLWEYVAPDPKKHYLFTVDPANFGSKGDFSSISVFDVHKWEEVACWEGFVQPTQLHSMLLKATKYYRQIGTGKGHTCIIESNAAALIGIAMREYTINPEEAYNVWHQTHGSGKGRTEPGWRASAKSLQEAEAAMDVALKNRDIILHSPTSIQQMINFDGNNRDRRIKKKGGTSHFELARTSVIAAWALTELNWPRALTEQEYQVRLQEELSHNAQVAAAKHRDEMRKLDENLRKRGRRSFGEEHNPWAPGAGWKS